MIQIELGNSYSRITGLKAEPFRALRALLSYEPDPNAALYSKWRPARKHLVDQKGYFPTGLLKRVEAFLYERQLGCTTVDSRIVPAASPIKTEYDVKPYPAQLKAVWSAKAFGRGGIVMPTGTGKSFVIALIAQAFGLKTLVVVPSLEIKKQLQGTLGAFKHVTVENIDSKRLQTLKGFDVLIIDETHHAAASTYQRLNKTAWAGIYYRFFLSATFFRNASNEHLLFEGLAGQVIYELSYKEAIANNYIVPVEAYVLEMPKVEVEGYTWAAVYKELVTNNAHRNNVLAHLMLRLNAGGASTLCLVKEIAHGEALSELSGIPFVNGQDEDSRSLIGDFNAGRIKTLIATTGVMGEGVDSKPCEYVIVAGLGKAKSAFMQQVGRAVRTFPGKESAKVILVSDPSHKWTKSHFKAQRDILLDEYGVVPVKLDIA